MRTSWVSRLPAGLKWRKILRQAVRFWNRHKWSYFFIAPSMILFFIFILFPMLQAFLMAFQKVDLRGSSWVGLGNFRDLMKSSLFWLTMQHTFTYALFRGCGLDTIFTDRFFPDPAASAAESIIFSECILPAVCHQYCGHLSGLVMDLSTRPGLFCNYLLAQIGLQKVIWLQSPRIALWAIILSTVLVVPGTGVVLYSAAMGSVPTEYYEVAEVEGANAFHKLFLITFPLLKPTTLYLMVIYTIAESKSSSGCIS